MGAYTLTVLAIAMAMSLLTGDEPTEITPTNKQVSIDEPNTESGDASGDLRDCAVMALEIASQQGANRTARVVTGE